MIPTRADEKAIARFKKWLIHHACLEEIDVTNEWEIFRFKYENGVLVLYKNAGGIYSVNSPDVHTAYKCYKNGNPFPWKEKAANRNRTSQYKRSVRKRDGNDCFYCGIDIEDVEDMTLEHLLSLCHGGKNRLENMAGAHKKCNEMAGNLSVVEKIKLRDRLRAQNDK